MPDQTELLGVFLQSFGRACINLKLLTAEDEQLDNLQPFEWYPSNRFTTIFQRIVERYPTPDPIKERIGAEMMKLWYDEGPGRAIVKRGIDFLHHQTGSQGYRGVVRGPVEQLGSFTLESIEPEQGRARVRSTTPFDRTMERGVLLGGLQLAGDLVFVDVNNSQDRSVFEIRFH